MPKEGSVEELVESFERLPGIGRKTAQKLAYYMLTLSEKEIKEYCQTIENSHKRVKKCEECKSYTDKDNCKICGDDRREKGIICVVESSKDIEAIEKTKEYRGVYHVLHGLLSPMDGIGPDEIHIKELLVRVEMQGVKEVILATNGTVEGEATAMYIGKVIKYIKDIKITRLGYGMPVGGELEYTDELTINKAIENRQEI